MDKLMLKFTRLISINSNNSNKINQRYAFRMKIGSKLPRKQRPLLFFDQN